MTLPPLLALENAQERLLALASPLHTEHVDIQGALGRYLAAPLLARRTQPSTALSAMDGYAVSRDDLTGPWQVVGESAAGHPFTGIVHRGEAVRISTGAHLPQGADIVLIQEDIAREGNRIALTSDAPSPPDLYVRPSGMDFHKGKTVLPQGTRIGPAQAALAIAAGYKLLPVHAVPSLCVIDSGDELTNDPENCAAHQIPASNGLMVKAMAADLGVTARLLDPIGDSLPHLTRTLQAQSHDDIIVISGGASVGDHDLVRPALEAIGASLDFWRVAIKPGKPLLVATRNIGAKRQIILGLPGNPVSTCVTAYHLLLPLLRQFQGASAVLPRPIMAQLNGNLAANGKRHTFVRAQWDGHSVTPHPVQDSGALVSLASSNVLIDRPAHAHAAQVGTQVPVFWLQNGGFV